MRSSGPKCDHGMPHYHKPGTPGLSVDPDGNVSIYVRIAPDASFDEAARELFTEVREAQLRYPDRTRLLYVDIEGHTGANHGFDDDFFEFQQEFVFSAIAPFVSALALPILKVVNPSPQRNDLPDRLQINPPPNKTES